MLCKFIVLLLCANLILILFLFLIWIEMIMINSRRIGISYFLYLEIFLNLHTIMINSESVIAFLDFVAFQILFF